MADLCPLCGRGFVAREPFVRTDTVARLDHLPFEAMVETIKVGYFHLACAPWGDPRYRISRPEPEPHPI